MWYWCGNFELVVRYWCGNGERLITLHGTVMLKVIPLPLRV